MSATDRRDVIDVLAGGHRAVEVLFERLETGAGAPAAARKSLVDALALELAWHTTAAQRYVLPLARRALPDGDALADRHTAEHLTVEHMVRDLEAKDPSDARFEPLLAQLMAAARGHIEHEERITFVELVRQCDRGELLAAGEELAAARRRAESGSALAGAGTGVGTGVAAGTLAAAGTLGTAGMIVAAATLGTPGPPTPWPAPGAAAEPAPSVVDRVRALLSEA
jgi:hypothetical protein